MATKIDGSAFRLSGEELVKSLKTAHWLPFYDHNGVKETAKEIGEHLRRLMHTTALLGLGQADPQLLNAAMVLYNSAVWRNRKCVLAYLMYRLEKLQSLRLQVTTELNVKVKEKLSLGEVKYFKQYSDVLENYCNDVRVNITTGLLPPSESLIDVRIGQSFDAFEAGKQYFVRPEYVERGILCHKALHLTTGFRN
jgi:hypothetical protein